MNGADFDADEVERWFVQRGVPQAIFHYNAAEDVLTRMVPYLTAVFLLGSLAGFGDRFAGWAQFLVAVAAFGILTGMAVVVNRWRGRRSFALPEDVGLIEIGLFLLGAPLIAFIFNKGDGWFPLWLLLLNVAMFGIGYAVTSYGAVPMLRWGIGELQVQLRGLLMLVARLLPLLLLFATFLFLNAEVWQVAHGLTPALFVIVIAMVLGPAVAFVVLRSPGEVASLHRFASWNEIDRICAGTTAPLPIRTDSSTEAPSLVPLDEAETRNLTLLMVAAQLVQILLVGMAIGSFFVAFGLLTVREETLLQWTEITAEGFEPIARFDVFGAELVMTWELFAVAGFIASISALQFAVSLISDELYREQFFASLEIEIREVLAVRARYLEPLVANTEL